MSYTFDIPSTGKSIIKVIGVGGGGCNAVNHMFNQGIKDVEFIVCNTDAQVMKTSPVPTKLQLGANLTKGLGAGTNPEIGKNSAIESREDIRELLNQSTEMIFITAGMGGGTGTGAAPIIAKVAKEMDILTVGIVTMPFSFEGKKKKELAEKGIAELKEHCDTVIVILNDKIREIYGNTSLLQAFSQADNILTTAAKSIAEIITMPGIINIDFADVKTVMQNSGAAVMGAAEAGGKDRAMKAAEQALNSPLLNNTDIKGAQKILVSIMGSNMESITMDEYAEINDYFQETAGENASLKCGIGIDETLADNIRVTVIATGFAVIPETPILPVADFTRTVIDLDSSRKTVEADTFISPQQPQQPASGTVTPTEYTLLPIDDSREKRTETVVYDLTGAHQYEQLPLFEVPVQQRTQEEIPGLDEKKEILRRQAQERAEKLRQNSMWNMNAQEFKERLEVPAYLRKKVSLDDVQHSSEKNISRYNLSDDNELLGNNKFLHDNVD